MRSVVILGATGSIGTNALEIIRQHRDSFRLSGIAVDSDWEGAARIADGFDCDTIAIRNAEAGERLRDARPNLTVLVGDDASAQLASLDADVKLAAISGSAGLPSVLAAIESGGQLALANKESLVCGGPALLERAASRGVEVVPVDSEHSGLFQCYLSGRAEEVDSVLITASGGPFRDATLDAMANATVDQALAHPNWPMGRKNSLDSATLANKGLELIEACYLFGLPESAVQVLVNPNSLFHAAVQYSDGSMIAQISNADMKVAIAYALGWPERLESGVAPLDLGALGRLEFWPPDKDRFPSLWLARAATQVGQSGTLLFNAANEVAGVAFFDGRIGFMDIPAVIETCLDRGGDRFGSALEDVITADREAKRFCSEMLGRFE